MLYEHDDAQRSMIRRARIVKVDDSKSQQFVDLKGLKQEEPKKIFRPQDHGFSSNPPKDTEGVMIQMGGRSDRTVYFDGGHEKYRPKSTPEGGTVIYNHSGDVIRVFKDNLQAVHSKKIVHKIGKGNDVGQGDNLSDSKNITITMQGDSIVINFQDTSFKLEAGKATVKGPVVLIDSPDVNLGGMGGTLIGLCGGGCATKVKAV